jgi:hypothetical protein
MTETQLVHGMCKSQKPEAGCYKTSLMNQFTIAYLRPINIHKRTSFLTGHKTHLYKEITILCNSVLIHFFFIFTLVMLQEKLQ